MANEMNQKNTIFQDLVKTAKKIKSLGLKIIRGHAYKPLTFPYRSKKYYETREKGIEWLAKAKEKYNIPIITEIMEEKFIPLISEVTDIIQIGSRNMQNYPFLKNNLVIVYKP